MVYINENSGTISIPRHTYYITSGYTLVVMSNVSDTITLVEDEDNISTNSLYYKFPLSSLNCLNVGEYTYKLYGDSDDVLEIGILMFGNFDRTVIVNNTFNKEKIQYNG